jgi:hypothetical protein
MDRSAWICIGLFALPFLLFFRETVGLQVFYVHDIQYYFFPYRKVAADIMHSGHLPLWNPYVNAGMPLLGDGQTALLYPPNWLIFLLPTAHALTLAILSTYSIAGVGMFLYLRQLRFDRAIATICAIGFMFCGFLVSHLVHVSIPATAALVPWICFALERLIHRPSAGNFALAALTVAIQCTAGHPQIPIYCAVAIGCYTLVISLMRWISTRQLKPALSPLGLLIAMYLTGGLLAAIQLVPWAELSRLSPRVAKTPYDLFASFSLTGTDWLLLLFPYGYGGLQTSWMQSLPDVDFGLIVYMWERLPYVGLLPLALAMMALAGGWRLFRVDSFKAQRLIALTGILLVMLLIAAGGSTPLGRLVYNIPLLGNLRGQARATALVAFAINALAAFGLHSLRERHRIHWIAIGASAALLLAVIVSLTVASAMRSDRVTSASQFLVAALKVSNRNGYVPLIFAVLTSGTLVWSALGGLTRAKVLVIGGLVGIELASFALTFNPTIDPKVFVNVPPSVQFLRKDPDPFRVAIFAANDRLAPQVAQDQLAISWAMPFHLEDVNSFNSLQPKRLVDFLFGHLRPQEDVSYGGMHPGLLVPPYNRVLTLLSVRYILLQKPFPWTIAGNWVPVFEDENVTIVRNPEEVGRAFFAGLVLVPNDPHRGLEMVHDPNFDPTRYAVVERTLSEEEAKRLSSPMTTLKAPPIEVQRVSPNELRLRASVDVPRLLVVNETFFPGWAAQLKQTDGSWQDVPIHRANYLFRGVVMPAGQHELRMTYRPASVRIGAAISFVTALALIAMIVFEGWRRQRQPTAV